MATATKSGQNLSFVYDADGLRTTKTVNGVVYTYYYSGGKLMRLTYTGNTLDFFYDQNGTPFMLLQNGNIYYYITNAQGDVIRLVDINGNTAASYRYDPYGKAISALGSHATINPLRYRGYVFDHETGLYYLQSRYYDPEIGRFINADGLVSTGQGLLSNNMFAYCGNNPICRADAAGLFWNEAWDWITNIASKTFGAASSTVIQNDHLSETVPVFVNLFITVKTGTRTVITTKARGDDSKPVVAYATKRLGEEHLSSAGIQINISNFSLDYSAGLDDVSITGSLTCKDGVTKSGGVIFDLSELKIGFEHSVMTQKDGISSGAYTNGSATIYGLVLLYNFVTTGQWMYKQYQQAQYQ